LLEGAFCPASEPRSPLESMDREDGGEELSRRHLTPLGVHSQMMAYCRALGKKKPYLPPGLEYFELVKSRQLTHHSIVCREKMNRREMGWSLDRATGTQ
jgi:hypothetical protein